MPSHSASSQGAAPMKTIVALGIALLLLLPVTFASAATTYLNIPSIAGEDPVPGFPGAMALRSLTFTPDAFSVIKNVDVASPKLANAVASGTPLHTTSLLLYNATASGPPDITFNFPNTFATAYQIINTTPPTETDTFTSNFASLFLEIPGITGESSTPGHPGVIQLDSFTLAGNSFSFTKPVDVTSPHLQTAVILGTTFPAISLLLYNSSSPGSQPDAELLFSNDIASAYQVLNSSASVPDDQTTFNFATVTPEPAAALLLLPALSPLLRRRSRST
jgi:type VI protein secretion system component Hcp